jgi:histidinol phosphatase-like PHP family hydrolase
MRQALDIGLKGLAITDHRKFGSETPSFYDGFTVKY